jgi:mono/diheme cytochrome c family protein
MGDPEHFYPMPAFRDQLAEDDIWAVIAYLKTLWNEEQRANQQRVTEAEAGG